MLNHGNIIKAFEYNDVINPILLQLTEPLYKNFGISTFAYTKIFEDRIFKISSNNEWFRFHITNEFYQQDHYQKDILQFDNNNTYIKFWNDASSNLVQAMYQHNLWYGVSIYKKFEDYIEMWSFATNKDNYNIVDFYMNNIDFLRRFIFYFKNKAAKLIDSSDKEKFIYRKKKLILDSNNNNLTENKNFLHETMLNYININNKTEVHISRREMECMYMLSLGLSPKEIGKILDISHRTVETYIHKVKHKFGYHYKRELVTNFQKELIDYYKPEIYT